MLIRPSNLTDPRILHTHNPKTLKGQSLGYMTGILHLAPARLSGAEVCPARTPGCTASCLNTAGRGHMQGTQDARVRKTQWLRSDRRGFMLTLERGIEYLVRKAERAGLVPCVRLNGTSDLLWENMRYQRANGERVLCVMDVFPDVQFYDYTKIPERMWSDLPPNYDLTYSYAETAQNQAPVKEIFRSGGRVAAVFRNAERPLALPKQWQLPGEYLGRPIVDADTHDLRFLDPHGVWCGLRAKGQARTDTSGFAIDVAPA